MAWDAHEPRPTAHGRAARHGAAGATGGGVVGGARTGAEVPARGPRAAPARHRPRGHRLRERHRGTARQTARRAGVRLPLLRRPERPAERVRRPWWQRLHLLRPARSGEDRRRARRRARARDRPRAQPPHRAHAEPGLGMERCGASRHAAHGRQPGAGGGGDRRRADGAAQVLARLRAGGRLPRSALFDGSGIRSARAHVLLQGAAGAATAQSDQRPGVHAEPPAHRGARLEGGQHHRQRAPEDAPRPSRGQPGARRGPRGDARDRRADRPDRRGVQEDRRRESERRRRRSSSSGASTRSSARPRRLAGPSSVRASWEPAIASIVRSAASTST